MSSSTLHLMHGVMPTLQRVGEKELWWHLKICIRDGEIQKVRRGTARPARREESMEVEVGVQMAMIPDKGVYSVGATISVLTTIIEEADQDQSPWISEQKAKVSG